MRFVYTKEDGSISVVHPSTKDEIEKNLGHAMSDEEYKQHVIERSTPKGATLHEVDAKTIPATREWRYAWSHDSDSKQVIIDAVRAKECMLYKSYYYMLELDKKIQEMTIMGDDVATLQSELDIARKIHEKLKAVDVKPGVAVAADLSMMKNILENNVIEMTANAVSEI